MLDDTPRVRLGAMLEEASRKWAALLAAALEERQVPVLGAAAHILRQTSLAGVSQAELAARVGLSKQAVQQSLDQLEGAGLVTRLPDPADRRAKRVLLTAAGLYALEAQQDAERAVERRLKAELGRKGFARLRKSLRKLGAARG